jgi:hypothetical protein
MGIGNVIELSSLARSKTNLRISLRGKHALKGRGGWRIRELADTMALKGLVVLKGSGIPSTRDKGGYRSRNALPKEDSRGEKPFRSAKRGHSVGLPIRLGQSRRARATTPTRMPRFRHPRNRDSTSRLSGSPVEGLEGVVYRYRSGVTGCQCDKGTAPLDRALVIQTPGESLPGGSLHGAGSQRVTPGA